MREQAASNEPPRYESPVETDSEPGMYNLIWMYLSRKHYFDVFGWEEIDWLSILKTAHLIMPDDKLSTDDTGEDNNSLTGSIPPVLTRNKLRTVEVI